MKSLTRLKTSLQDIIQDILNKQMVMEAESSAMYLAMSAWCHQQGLIECASYFKKQSGEEREHMLRIFDYICDMGGIAISPAVAEVKHEYSSLKEVLETALEQEIKITESFNRIVDTCIKAKDYQTVKFCDWFLEEQMEEEQQARRALEIHDLIGTENDGLFKIDHQIGKLAKE
ncbi:MAG: ferritin [Cytophagales bacterium]|nr:ferritin [Cytophagales bacterium]MDW8385183.1 ferritin [Flammeovirgaceae bacterium]